MNIFAFIKSTYIYICVCGSENRENKIYIFNMHKILYDIICNNGYYICMYVCLYRIQFVYRCYMRFNLNFDKRD